MARLLPRQVVDDAVAELEELVRRDGVQVLNCQLALQGLATAAYIGAQLGRGPRDGLMTGLSRRTGRSLRLVRTAMEPLAGLFFSSGEMSSVIASTRLVLFGGLIIFFLVVEPEGLNRLWRNIRNYFRVWPFSY